MNPTIFTFWPAFIAVLDRFRICSTVRKSGGNEPLGEVLRVEFWMLVILAGVDEVEVLAVSFLGRTQMLSVKTLKSHNMI